MSKLTPGVFRLVSVLKIMAGDPGRSWSLSELVDELGISRSTCHALMVSLDEANLVYRNAAKRYSLGTVAIDVGRAAERFFQEADVVRREIEDISREFGTITVSNYRRKAGILIRDWIDPLASPERISVAGQLIPLAPPWGTVFYACETIAEQRRWLAGEGSIVRDRQLMSHIVRGLKEIESRRYHCGIWSKDTRFEFADMNGARSVTNTDHFFWNFRNSEKYNVKFFAAPVIDENGKAILAISITGFNLPLNGSEIEKIGNHLVARCRKLGQTISRAAVVGSA